MEVRLRIRGGGGGLQSRIIDLSYEVDSKLGDGGQAVKGEGYPHMTWALQSLHPQASL